MTDYPRVAFVSAPAVGATVRLNLNEPIGAAGCQVNADGFSLGAPSLDGDPTAVGQVWGERTITLTPRLTGAKSAVLAALSTLAREQLRADNWLLVQLTALHLPVWFKVYRSPPQALSLDEVDVAGSKPDAWETSLSLVADAFGYGARETLSTVTFGSSLVATNPMQYALPAIKGDAQTALRLTLTATNGALADIRATRLAVIAADATVTSTVIDVGTGDGLTAGTGTAAATTDAAYLGGSYRTVTVAASANNLVTRVSGSVTPTAGRHKVLVRVVASPVNTTTPNRYSFAFSQTSGLDVVDGTTTFLDTPAYDGSVADTFNGWVDLGEFTFPRNAIVPDDLSPTQPASTWGLKVGTPDAVAGTVKLDAIKLVPVDGPTIRATTMLRTSRANTAYFLTSGATSLNWDGDAEATWQHVTSSGTLVANDLPYVQAGGFPVADPGATQNLLVILPDGNMSNAAGTWTVVPSYHPRYLHLPES